MHVLLLFLCCFVMIFRRGEMCLFVIVCAMLMGLSLFALCWLGCMCPLCTDQVLFESCTALQRHSSMCCHVSTHSSKQSTWTLTQDITHTPTQASVAVMVAAVGAGADVTVVSVGEAGVGATEGASEEVR